MESYLVKTYDPFPFVMTKGEGVWVYDESGQKYLDLYGGHAVALLGHCPRELIEAINQQASKLYFYSTLANIPIREAAAKSLIDYTRVENMQGDFSKVFFCNSGAEANENALKLALQKTGRKNLVAFKGGWHGRSLLCMSVTDDPKWHASMECWAGDVLWSEINNVETLNTITTDTAAVIIEPIQSIGGVRVAEDSFLQALRERCDKVGAWLIFDEIQTGLGRTGTPFISGFCGISPDIMTLAKGLASGFPIGAVVMQKEVADTIGGSDMGSTFGGGPMAMAALNKTIEILKSKRLAEHARDIGDYLRSKIQGLSIIDEIRGSGCLIGLKANIPAKVLQGKLLEKKILTGTSGDPNILRLLPSVIIEREHIDHFIEVLKEF